jgi:DNA-binding NtrC family response regulator
MSRDVKYVEAGQLQKRLDELEEEILADIAWLGEHDRAIRRSLQTIHAIREAMEETAREQSAEELEKWSAGGVTLEELEKHYILATLERLGGNRAAASEALGLPRRTLYRRLAGYGVLSGRDDSENTPGE